MTLESIEALARIYGYLILFPLSVVEGPIVTVIASFLASLGFMNVFLVYAISVVGDLIEDNVFYILGSKVKDRIIRNGKFWGLTLDRLQNVEEHFKEHAGKTILIGKLTHGIGFATLIAAGTVQMSYRRFITFNIIGTLIKSAFFVVVGFYFGKAYQSIDTFIGYWITTTILIISVFLISFIVLKRKK